MKSPKEHALDDRILATVPKGICAKCAELMLDDAEIQALQDYANAVTIRRLNYNDHGPVHMRKVLLYALLMAELLGGEEIPLSLEAEGVGTHDDSLVAVMLASFLHDVGMAVGRQNHEINSALFSFPVITRLLESLYPDSLAKRIAVRSVAIEGIEGHMATQRIHSLEAGLILVADGCDMEKGRARIPMLLSTEARVGDIHQFSAAAINSVGIAKGATRPIRIDIRMATSVGFFQVEEVLLQKIQASPVKKYIELVASVEGDVERQYLG